MMTVCRLCGNTELIIDMFDDSINTSKRTKWRFFIILSTGVHIRKDDLVSKMVCHTCCELVEKIYKYRINAVANDKLLKEQLGQVYVPPVTDPEELQRIGVKILADQTDGDCEMTMLNTSSTKKTDCISDLVPKPVYRHKSVNSLITKYPGVILPEEVNRCDINPEVTLDECEVKDWYDEYFLRFQQRLSLRNIAIKRVDNNVNNYIETKHNGDDKSNAELLDEILSEIPLGDEELPITQLTTTDAISSINRLCLLASTELLNKPCPKSKKPETTTSLSENSIISSEKLEEDNITTIANKLKYKPCPKSKKVQHLYETTSSNQQENKFVSSEKPRQSPTITVISEVVYKPCPKSKKAEQVSETTDGHSEIPSEKPEENSIVSIINEVLSLPEVSKTQINHVSTTTIDTAVLKKKRKYRKKLLAELPSEEVIPQKKQRVYHNKNSLSMLDKLDIPEQIPSNITEHKELLASSLGLTPITEAPKPNDERVFACNMCLKLYDTNKQLRLHQRLHLRCKYCGLRMSSTKRLQIHENQTCHVKIKANPPILQLTRVDEIPSIADKYLNAFRRDDVVCIYDSDDDTNHYAYTISNAHVGIAKKANSMMSKQSIPINNGQDMTVRIDNSQSFPTSGVPPSHEYPSNLKQLTDPQWSALRLKSINKHGQIDYGPVPTASSITPKAPTSYSLSQMEDIVSNIAIQNRIPANTPNSGKSPSHFKELMFTEGQLADISSAMSTECSPNSVFHYIPMATAANESAGANQSTINANVRMQYTPIAVANTSEAWVTAPNKTVHQIPVQGSSGVSVLQAPLAYAGNSGINILPEYVQPETLMSNIYQTGHAQSAVQWLQPDRTQNSAASSVQTSNNAIDVEQFSASEAIRHLANVSISPVTAPSYIQYAPHPLNQVNYYNVQSGYPYPSYNNTTVAHSGNLQAANQTHNVASYTNPSPAHNQSVNAINLTNTNPNSTNNRSRSLQNGSNVNRYMVPNTGHSENVPKKAQRTKRVSKKNPSGNLPKPSPSTNDTTKVLQHPSFGSNQALKRPGSSPNNKVKNYSNTNAAQSLLKSSLTQTGNGVQHSMPPGPNQPINIPSPTLQYAQSSSAQTLNRPSVNQTTNVVQRALPPSPNQPINRPSTIQYSQSSSTQSLNRTNVNQTTNVVQHAMPPSPKQSVNRPSPTLQYSQSNSTQSLNRQNANQTTNAVQYSMPILDEPINIQHPAPTNIQHPQTSSAQLLNRPSGNNMPNVSQYSRSSSVNLVTTKDTEQTVNARRYSNPAPPHYTSVPNVSASATRNPSPSYSGNVSGNASTSGNTVTSQTGQTPRKGVLRVKQTWELC